MRHIQFRQIISLPFIFAIAIISSCGAEDSRLAPFGWTAAGDGSDSLLVGLEYMVQNAVPADSLAKAVDLYSAVSASGDPQGRFAPRRLYWQAKALRARGQKAAGDSLIREALALCDSVRQPYDFRRFRWQVETAADFQDNAARYARYVDDYEFFSRCGDRYMQFVRAIDLSRLMMEAGMYDRALDYALACDSLLVQAGMPQNRTGNRVNIAVCRFNMADTAGAVEILRGLLSEPDVMAIPQLQCIVDFNLYQMAGDTMALSRAWSNVRDDSRRVPMRGLVATAKASESLKMRRPDEAGKLALYIAAAAAFPLPDADAVFVRKTLADIAASRSGDNNLVMAYEDYARAEEGYHDRLHKSELIAAETSRMIFEAETAAESRRRADALRFYIIIAAIILAALAAAFCIRLHIIRLDRRRLLQQLEIERQGRSRIAMSLLLEEKDQLVRRLEQRLEALVEEKRISETEVKELSSAIKTDTAAASDIENFASVFRELSPAFTAALLERYPRLGKTSVRLASYIALGMDTNHIARMMNIRKESVMQARWRLRTQMALPPDQDLDTTLRTLANK